MTDFSNIEIMGYGCNQWQAVISSQFFQAVSVKLFSTFNFVLLSLFTGYSPLHYAAAWGRIGNMKVLVEFNCNLQQRNVNNERPRETAIRYNQTECVDYLDWAG